MPLDPSKISQIQTLILSRYAEHGRNLPRRETTDPYEILVSEVMSQQTQVARIIPKRYAFLDTAPDAHSLATLDKHTLLSLRSGLGYNNRALRLQQTAQIIVDQYDGTFPQDEKSLLSLPGIGPYTAHALMAFARNVEVPVLDINIRRVLVTLLDLPKNISDSDLRDIAIVCIPSGESRIWHNALMDYGALVLTAKKTNIKSTPQSTFYGSRRRVRWSIMKELVEHTSVALQEMREKYDHEEFDNIIKSMKKDWLIELNSNDTITLS